MKVYEGLLWILYPLLASCAWSVRLLNHPDRCVIFFSCCLLQNATCRCPRAHAVERDANLPGIWRCFFVLAKLSLIAAQRLLARRPAMVYEKSEEREREQERERGESGKATFSIYWIAENLFSIFIEFSVPSWAVFFLALANCCAHSADARPRLRRAPHCGLIWTR